MLGKQLKDKIPVIKRKYAITIYANGSDQLDPLSSLSHTLCYNFALLEVFMQSDIATQKDFKDGLPRYTVADNAPIQFEIKLVPKGEIPPNTVIRAYVDDSQQYQADGTCWRAVTSAPMVKVGQRIEKWDVVGWRRLENDTQNQSKEEDAKLTLPIFRKLDSA